LAGRVVLLAGVYILRGIKGRIPNAGFNTYSPQCFVRDEGRRGPALLIFTTVPLCRRVGRENAFGGVVPLHHPPFLCRWWQEDYR